MTSAMGTLNAKVCDIRPFSTLYTVYVGGAGENSAQHDVVHDDPREDPVEQRGKRRFDRAGSQRGPDQRKQDAPDHRCQEMDADAECEGAVPESADSRAEAKHSRVFTDAVGAGQVQQLHPHDELVNPAGHGADQATDQSCAQAARKIPRSASKSRSRSRRAPQVERGSIRVTSRPRCGRLASVSAPPWACAMSRAMQRPSPVPPVSRLREDSTR